MAITISFPFRLDNRGIIQTTTDESEHYLSKIRSVLSTSVLEKPMDPLYGFDMGRSLYENIGSFIPAVKDAIYRAVSLNLPDVSINDINFIPLNEGDTPQYRINILVDLPNNKNGNISISSSTFSSNGTISGSIL